MSLIQSLYKILGVKSKIQTSEKTTTNSPKNEKIFNSWFR